jgi:hypothetical protein
VQAWRAKAILTFNDQWLEEDLLATEVMPRPLGVMISRMGAVRRYSEPMTGRSSAPAPPEFIALRSSGWAKKKGQGCALPIRLLAHLDAQVALQQGLILRVGRGSIANLFSKWAVYS